MILSVNIDNLFRQDIFKDVDKDLIKMIKKLSKNIEGKETLEALYIVKNFIKTTPDLKKLTKQQEVVLINEILRELPEEDQYKIKGMLKLLGYNI